MRGALIISLLIVGLSANSQEKFHDPSQYSAFLEGEWKTVLTYSKLAKKEKKDYYYLRYRNGYAAFMVKRYRQSTTEFSKALAFNSGDPSSKYYKYWSLVYAGEFDAARMMTSKLSQVERDSIKVFKPKVFSGISVLGGYRISTSPNTVSSMPYVQIGLSHEFGTRLRLDHGVSYLNGARRDSTLWQVGYLAQLGIQASESTSFTPFFLMQYWESGSNWPSGGYKVFDLGSGISFRQRLGNFDISAFGGFMERTDLTFIQGNLGLSWYPFGNSDLYSHSTLGYAASDSAGNFVLRQTIGGKLYKGLWLSSTFVWNNEIIPFESGKVNFSNTSLDDLNWKWGITPNYWFNYKWSIWVNYTVESRDYNALESSIDQELYKYNFHSVYLGLTKKF